MRRKRRRLLQGIAALLAGAAGGGARGQETGIAPPGGRLPIEGSWLGTIALPQGGEAAFGLSVAPLGDGRQRVRYYLPRMHVYGLPFPAVERLPDGRWRLDPVGSIAALHDDTLAGGFAYPQLPFVLRRVDALPVDDPPAMPVLPAGPGPRWTSDLGAPVWGSPVVAGDSVCVAGTDGSVSALSARDGRTLWRSPGPVPFHGSALVHGPALFLVDDRGQLVRIDRRSGVRSWTVGLSASIDSADSTDPTFNHRTPTPVAIDGRLVVAGSPRELVVVDPQNGRIVRRIDLPGTVHGAIAAMGRHWIVGLRDEDGIAAIDSRTGRVAWRVSTSQPVCSTPVVAGDLALVGARDFLLYGLDANSGAVRWRHSYLFSWVESVPAIHAGVAYIGASDLRCVSAIDLATGHARWSTDVYGLSWGTPALAGERVYAGTAGQKDVLIDHRPGVVALSRRTGEVAWRFPLPVGTGASTGVVGSPVVAGGLVVVATVEGRAYAFSGGR